MKLQTQIPLQKQQYNQIDYQSSLLLLGSCFVENIGDKLNYFKFQSVINPLGILFHPKAIETLIKNAVEEKTYSEKDIFFHNEQWHCFEAHSKLSRTSKEELLKDLNDSIQITNKQIKDSTHIVITLGTAWVYKHFGTNKVVANCHKVPQKQFKKELLPVEEVTSTLENIVTLIKSVNSEASIIFTVSPVRHIKDGFVENTQSKSHLITAIHKFLNCNRALSGAERYFPSYEIMMDELRDYRFYKDDMLHPNKVAVDYIWEKFQDVWISSEASKTMETVDAIQKGLRHKPFNPKLDAHQKFLQSIENKKELLQKEFSHIVF